MDRGAWRATVHGVTKELDTTEQLTCTFAPCKMGIIILILQMKKLKVLMEMGFHERKKPSFRSCDIWLNHLILQVPRL